MHTGMCVATEWEKMKAVQGHRREKRSDQKGAATRASKSMRAAEMPL